MTAREDIVAMKVEVLEKLMDYLLQVLIESNSNNYTAYSNLITLLDKFRIEVEDSDEAFNELVVESNKPTDGSVIH